MAVLVVGGVEGTLDAIAAEFGEDPVFALGVVVGVAVLLGVGWWLFGLLGRTPGDRFAGLLADEESVAVLMHPNPDPDAMACALAVQEIGDDVGTGTTLYYPGQIRHQENRAFETVLDVEFERIENAGQIDEDEVVLVDHNEARGFAGAERLSPLAVVDHHPGNGSGEEFTDVRTENGACATIFSEYFDSLDWEPIGPAEMASLENGKEVIPPRTATGLVYGIQSDTKHLTTGCSDAEFQAAAYLYRGIDEDKLDRIANPEVDAEVLDVKARAIDNRDVRNAFAISDVGTVSNADAVPQAADELLRLEGVTAVVVLAEKDGTIHLSGRSRDDRVHMGKTLDAAVSNIPMASAGGHARMGGGQLSIEHMEGLGPGDGLTRDQFCERLFQAMSGDV